MTQCSYLFGSRYGLGVSTQPVGSSTGDPQVNSCYALSSTHMWHLQASLTHRLLEPFSLMFGVTYPIIGNVSNDLLPTFTHIFRRNLYLDSIMRLLPTVEVSVHQECILRLTPQQLSQRRVRSPSSLLAVLGQLVWHQEVFFFLPEQTHEHPTKIIQTSPSPEALPSHKTPLPNYQLMKSNKRWSK